MDKSFIDELLSDDEGRKLYNREELIFDVTEAVCEVMIQKRISKTKLAQLAGVCKSNITHLLSGDHNMTLATISDLLYALDSKMTISVAPLDIEGFGDKVSTLKKGQWVPSDEPPMFDISDSVEKRKEWQEAA
jgi:DNA-binding Xre family transcriptional regulator